MTKTQRKAHEKQDSRQLRFSLDKKSNGDVFISGLSWKGGVPSWGEESLNILVGFLGKCGHKAYKIGSYPVKAYLLPISF